MTHCPQRTTLGIDRRDGAFADYLALPAGKSVSPSRRDNQRSGSLCGATRRGLSNPRTGFQSTIADQVLVIGDGKLGLLCAQVLHRTGCRLTVLGRHQEKLQILAARGIHTSQDPASLSPGFDSVVEATGTPDGFALAGQCVRPRGTIVLKSTYHGQTAVDMTALVVHEITVVGSRCGPFPRAIELLKENAIDVESLIHKRFPIEQGTDAFEHAATKGVLKVLLEMT